MSGANLLFQSTKKIDLKFILLYIKRDYYAQNVNFNRRHFLF